MHNLTLTTEEKHKPLTDSLKDSRFRSSLGISVISSLSTILSIEEASNVVDIVTTLASFTSERDPWTTQQSCRQALEVLDSYVSRRRSDDPSSLWSTLEDTLKSRIKPLFAKTKNPAITSTGRKNLHPMPATRFDYSSLDPETKPWKYRDVYCTTVFSWILSIYQVRVCGFCHYQNIQYLQFGMFYSPLTSPLIKAFRYPARRGSLPITCPTHSLTNRR